jgi:hypothetical protein
MENQKNLDDDVLNILAILKQSPTEEKSKPQEKISITGKKNVPKKSQKELKKDKPSGITVKKEGNYVVAQESKSNFLINVDEPEDKSIYNSKVLIREEIYEIFMSLKRIKKFKSVSTLIDSALEEYIKNHREEIRKTLYDNSNNAIL